MNPAIEIKDTIGEEHTGNSLETPLRKDAFEMEDTLKIKLIQKHFSEIMHLLWLDLTDDSLSGTPHRVAKMYVKEVFAGLNPANKPNIKLFENKYRYNEMLIEKNITLYSYCEHHFVPIVSSPNLRPAKVRVNSNQFINFKLLNNEETIYREPDRGCNQETRIRCSC